jgi:hypothetical protein
VHNSIPRMPKIIKCTHILQFPTTLIVGRIMGNDIRTVPPASFAPPPDTYRLRRIQLADYSWQHRHRKVSCWKDMLYRASILGCSTIVQGAQIFDCAFAELGVGQQDENGGPHTFTRRDSIDKRAGGSGSERTKSIYLVSCA